MTESQGPVWMVGTASESLSYSNTPHATESPAGEHAIIYEYYCLNARNHYMGLIQTETVRPDDDVDALLVPLTPSLAAVLPTLPSTVCAVYQ